MYIKNHIAWNKEKEINLLKHIFFYLISMFLINLWGSVFSWAWAGGIGNQRHHNFIITDQDLLVDGHVLRPSCLSVSRFSEAALMEVQAVPYRAQDQRQESSARRGTMENLMEIDVEMDEHLMSVIEGVRERNTRAILVWPVNGMSALQENVDFLSHSSSLTEWYVIEVPYRCDINLISPEIQETQVSASNGWLRWEGSNRSFGLAARGDWMICGNMGDRWVWGERSCRVRRVYRGSINRGSISSGSISE